MTLPDNEFNALVLHMVRLHVPHPRLQFFLDLIDVEVNGQGAYFQACGDFPQDQLAFTLTELEKRGYEL